MTSETGDTERPLLVGENRDPRFVDGRRMLAQCLGDDGNVMFTLWEIWREGGKRVIEESEEIKRAWLKAISGINDASSSNPPETRIEWLSALLDLEESTRQSPTNSGTPTGMGEVSQKDLLAVPGCGFVGVKMVQTLGQVLSEIRNDDDKDSRDLAIGKAVTLFRSSLDLFSKRHHGRPMRGQKEGSLPIEIMMILMARSEFSVTQGTPTKAEVRSSVEAIGYGYVGKNRNKNWAEKFILAGLGELPDE